MSGMFPWFHRYLDDYDQTKLAKICACACKNIAWIYTSVCTLVTLCAHRGPACFPHSIDTLISLIQRNLAYIWACAWKKIVCMYANLYAQVIQCAQTALACSPDSIDTLISLICPNLAEIWPCTCKHIGCMHASLHAWVVLCCIFSDMSCMFSRFHIYLNLSDPTQFG